MQAELAALTRRLAERGHVPQFAGDEADVAVAHEAHELDHVARERMVARASALRAAIARIDAGTYGKCDLCDEEIGAARLKAMPAAEFCVKCQGRIEREAPERAFGIRREVRPTKPIEELE